MASKDNNSEALNKEQPDAAFFKRADAHIDLSNSQMGKDANSGQVSASMMFSLARFNAWLTAASSGNVIQMLDSKEDAIEYFVAEYKQMLEQNLDEYIENFDKYMGTRDKE